jgi:hypothetical protein
VDRRFSDPAFDAVTGRLPIAKDMIERKHSVFFSAAHAAKDSGIALAWPKTNIFIYPCWKLQNVNSIGWSSLALARSTSQVSLMLTFNRVKLRDSVPQRPIVKVKNVPRL